MADNFAVQEVFKFVNNDQKDEGRQGFLRRNRDPDADGLAPPVTIVTPPSHGNANPQTDGSVLYVPYDQYVGPDSFVYRICDTRGGCATALIVGLDPQVLSIDLERSGYWTNHVYDVFRPTARTEIADRWPYCV